MKTLAFCLPALFVALAAPCFASEAWTVVEGRQGAVKGTWNVELKGADVAGSAKMAAAHGGVVTYALAGKVEKGVYTVKRIAPSDHLDCAYRGVEKPDGSIAGSATCGAQSGPWIARPTDR